jgi:hypothetical protein
VVTSEPNPKQPKLLAHVRTACRVKDQLVRRLQKLGYAVTVEAPAA